MVNRLATYKDELEEGLVFCEGFLKNLRGKKRYKSFFSHGFGFRLKEICVLIDHRSSSGEREKLAEQPVAGQREGGLKKNDAESVQGVYCQGKKKRMVGRRGREGPAGAKVESRFKARIIQPSSS